MNPKGLAQQQNIESMSPAIQEKLKSLQQIPQELVGKIPESVWASLTADHRAEMLKQYGIYEKYLQIEIKAQQQVQQGIPQPELPTSTEVSLDKLNQTHTPVAQPVQQAQQKPVVVDVAKTIEIEGKNQFAEAVAEKNKIEATNIVEQGKQVEGVEKQINTESIAEKETVKRMQMENPQNVIDDRNARPVEKVLPKFSGYPIAENIPNNVDHMEEHGNPRDGATWTASFIKKIWAIFAN